MAKSLVDSREFILDFIKSYPGCSSKSIHEGLDKIVAYATVKRNLNSLLADHFIVVAGKGKASRYELSKSYSLIYPIDIEKYFLKEIDDRTIQSTFNYDLISGTLNKSALFTKLELDHLLELQGKFKQNILKLTAAEFKKEFERLAIDLSWKSSQIEGNTYSLLETEKLLKERETASGKTKDEAVMLLNHKIALDFILDHPTYIQKLTIANIEDLHSVLIKELNVGRNIRTQQSWNIFRERIIHPSTTSFRSGKQW